MLNCKQSSELISQAIDNKLSLCKRVALRAHILTCRNCAIFAKQLAIIHKAAPLLIERPNSFRHSCFVNGLSKDARERIAEAVKLRINDG